MHILYWAFMGASTPEHTHVQNQEHCFSVSLELPCSRLVRRAFSEVHVALLSCTQLVRRAALVSRAASAHFLYIRWPPEAKYMKRRNTSTSALHIRRKEYFHHILGGCLLGCCLLGRGEPIGVKYWAVSLHSFWHPAADGVASLHTCEHVSKWPLL
jgi:hypothetical protein